jgi:hypothetical protein
VVETRVTARTAGWALALVCAGQFVLQLDFSIVNVALPTIQASLHFAATDLQWVITGYALTFGSMLLTGGRAGDLIGKRRLLIAGLILFGLTSLSAGLAQSPALLIASRFLQGASAALVAPSTMGLLTATFAEGPERMRALAVFQGTTAAGATAGIVLGGVLTNYLGWEAIFLVNPPVILMLALLALRLLPVDVARASGRLDLAGAALITASTACLIYGLSDGQQIGFASVQVLLALAFAGALGIAFVVTERHTAAPMLPLHLLDDRMRWAGLITMLLMGGVIAAYVYFVSFYLQLTLHLSSLATGLALVPSTATVMATSMLVTRRALATLGVVRVLLLGLACAASGQVWLTRLADNGSYVTGVLPGLLLASVGMGLVFPCLAVAVSSGVEPAEQGSASALLASSQQTGSAAGLALLVTLAAGRSAAAGGSLVAGYQLSFAIGAAIIMMAAVIVVLLFGRVSMRPKPSWLYSPITRCLASASSPASASARRFGSPAGWPSCATSAASTMLNARTTRLSGRCDCNNPAAVVAPLSIASMWPSRSGK